MRVDAGTSTWLQAEARTDFHAETALEAVVHFLTQYGRPRRMTFDRDSRWVGSQSLRHFPSAFCRFLLCLGIHPNICPPHRPDKNAYVERLHRTLNQECAARSVCPPRLARCERQRRSFASTTTMSAPIKERLAAIDRHILRS